jgi:hypothetical protein
MHCKGQAHAGDPRQASTRCPTYPAAPRTQTNNAGRGYGGWYYGWGNDRWGRK